MRGGLRPLTFKSLVEAAPCPAWWCLSVSSSMWPTSLLPGILLTGRTDGSQGYAALSESEMSAGAPGIKIYFTHYSQLTQVQHLDWSAGKCHLIIQYRWNTSVIGFFLQKSFHPTVCAWLWMQSLSVLPTFRDNIQCV